jgi:hypothetical protein
MPISRPLLIVLAVAILALVGFYATQGSRDAVESAPIVSTPPPATDSDAPADAKGDPPTAVAKAESESEAPAKQKHRADRPAKARAAVSGPVAVRRAIDRHQRVVLFFGTPRGADDRATAVAVAMQRRPGVVVVLEPISKLVRYRDLIGGLGISQAPAVVIVDRDGAARLVEGYVDPATLAQEVADAR